MGFFFEWRWFFCNWRSGGVDWWLVAEQMERVEGGLDNINQDMKEAEEHLKGMEKCCGLCNLPCGKKDDFEGGADYANTWNKDDEGGVVSDQPRITVGDPGAMGGGGGGYVTKITNDAREDEMDENVQQVSSMVGNLRNMAIDMGTEVSNQNKQLDRINQKVCTNSLSQHHTSVCCARCRCCVCMPIAFSQAAPFLGEKRECIVHRFRVPATHPSIPHS